MVCRLRLQLQLYPNVIGLNDETGKLSSTSSINSCRLIIIESEFPNSSIQCDVYFFHLICLSSSYDHFFAADNS